MQEDFPKGQRWDWNQTDLLIRNFKKGLSIKEITELLNEYLKQQPGINRPERSYDSVAHKLKNLGLITEKKLSDSLKAKQVIVKFNRLNNYDDIKKEVFDRDKNRCALCSSKKFLELAHVIPFKKTYDKIPKELITLCKDCHKLFDSLNEFETKKVFSYMANAYSGYEKEYRITSKYNSITNKDMCEIMRKD